MAGARLGTASKASAADFHHHLNAARRPIDTYAMWGAAYQVMDGLCSDDGFWYFQPWLIGQGADGTTTPPAPLTTSPTSPRSACWLAGGHTIGPMRSGCSGKSLPTSRRSLMPASPLGRTASSPAC